MAGDTRPFSPISQSMEGQSEMKEVLYTELQAWSYNLLCYCYLTLMVCAYHIIGYTRTETSL